MTAQPAPKTKELENNIRYFLDNLLRPTEFDIRRLKKEAENIIKINAAIGYNYLGRIAVLENNREAVISNYENAIKFPSNNCAISLNYSSALGNCGLNDIALEKARNNFNKFPNNSDILFVLWNQLIFAARLNEASTLLDKVEDKTLFQFFNCATRIFDEANLTDDEAQNLQTLAYSIIEKNNLYLFTSEYAVIDDCVCFTIYIDKPVEEIFDINWELAGILADSVEDMRCGVLSFKYSSIEVLRERREYERSI